MPKTLQIRVYFEDLMVAPKDDDDGDGDAINYLGAALQRQIHALGIYSLSTDGSWRGGGANKGKEGREKQQETSNIRGRGELGEMRVTQSGWKQVWFHIATFRCS